MGINSYYFNNIDGRLIDIDNYDFWLSSDNQGQLLEYAKTNADGCSGNFDLVRDGLVLWLDVDNTGTTTNGNTLVSLKEWEDVNIQPQSGITSCDFGLTGVDNGRYNQLSGLTVNLTSGDTKITLYPVTGYTVTSANSIATKGKYDYPIAFNEDGTTKDICSVGNTLCLKGGFYQGYFKLDFEDPNPIKITATTTNDCGTTTTDELINVDRDATKYDLMPTTFDSGWTMETWLKWDSSICSGLTGNILNDTFTGNTGFFFYIGTRAENKFWDVFSGETDLYTCDGVVPLSPEGSQPIITTDGQDWFSKSSFGRSCKQVCTAQTPTVTATTYCDQLSENALGFRITPDGRIGYRKMTVSGFEYFCDDNGNKVQDTCVNSKYKITGTTMEEGYSEPIVQSGDNWTHVVVTYSQNTVKHGLPAGSLRFWINGRVVYRVDDFIGLQLRALDEWSSKQLGVPYNISWGGGTQGLLESQTFDGPDPKDQGLDLATNFAGTFEGELSQLRFYDKALNILEIRNNLYIDCLRYCVEETYGGSLIKQPTLDYCDEICSSNTLIYSDTTGIIFDLTAYVRPGSIEIEHVGILRKPHSEDLTFNFTNNLNVISGNTISVDGSIYIPTGSLSGSCLTVLNDNYNRLAEGYAIRDFIVLGDDKVKVECIDEIVYEMPLNTVTPPNNNNNNGTPPNNNVNTGTTTDDNNVVTGGNNVVSVNNTSVNTIYYGKLTTTSLNINDVDNLSNKTTKQIVNSYLELNDSYGYGYILIPEDMEQPSLFRNSNEGCLGFAVPTLLMDDVVLNNITYKVYRTFVSTHSSVDLWLCK